jgi:hypothetical protein
MTPSASRVCCWTLLNLSGASFASKKADMRSWILVDSSWNGSGVSETRGSANPVAVFIAEAVLGSTSKRASAEAAAVCRLLVVGETIQRHGASWTRCRSRGVGVEVSVAVLIDIGSRYFCCRPSAAAHLVRPLRADAVSLEELQGPVRATPPPSSEHRGTFGAAARVEQMPSRPEVVITRRYRL